MKRAALNSEEWIRIYHPEPACGIRLACFPHAGGSASFFFPVSRDLHSDAEVLAVQYPGRQDRRFEPMIGEIGALADEVARVLLPWHEDGPLALFGHSMGAVVAFETARRLERTTGSAPAVLFASGRRAPGLSSRETVHLRDDDGLIAELRRLSGTESALFDDDELLRATLPAIRNDYRAIETYSCAPDATVSCPIVALVGDRDPRVSTAEAQQWRRHTTGGFDLRVFPGGHFYLTEQAAAVIGQLRQRLRAPAARVG